ncbi:hypothetical protein, partial [Frankia sp. Cas3]|uniref:hypothetical protein n=1 Tax=Frankia sp. Cas3 TaxID=3073926 RepID=UPI002AD45DAB
QSCTGRPKQHDTPLNSKSLRDRSDSHNPLAIGSSATPTHSVKYKCEIFVLPIRLVGFREKRRHQRGEENIL